MSHLCDSSRRHYTWSSSLSEVMPSEILILMTHKSWLWTSLYPPVTCFRHLCPICLSYSHWCSACSLGSQHFPWDLTVNPKYHSGTTSSPVSAIVLCQVLSVPCCPDVVQSERASAQGPTELRDSVSERCCDLLAKFSLPSDALPSCSQKGLNVNSVECPEWIALFWKALCKCKILPLHPSLTYYSLHRVKFLCTESQHKAPRISQILQELHWPVAEQRLQRSIYMSVTSHITKASFELHWGTSFVGMSFIP